MLNYFWRRRTEKSAEEQFSFVVVGYPKAGNTWLRVLLGRYVQRLVKMQELPLFEAGDATSLTKALGPRAAGYFTHAPLEWSTQTADDLNYENVVQPFEGRKVILLSRHPLDVLVSLYMQRVHRAKPQQFSGDLVQFIESPVYGLDKLITFYELWRGSLDRANAMLWRYEDARANVDLSLRQVLTFLQLPVVDEMISDAAKFGSFNNMKEMEKSKSPIRYRSSGFQIFDSGDLSNPDAFHVRKGMVEGFRNDLPVEAAARFEAVIRDRLSSIYGYS